MAAPAGLPVKVPCSCFQAATSAYGRPSGLYRPLRLSQTPGHARTGDVGGQMVGISAYVAVSVNDERTSGQGLADVVCNPVQGNKPSQCRCLRPAAAASQGRRFAGDDARGMATADGLVFVNHPAHDFGIGVHVGCRNVQGGSQNRMHGPDVRPAQAFAFRPGQRRGIALHTSLPSAQRQIQHGGLEHHQGGQGPGHVQGFRWMETDAALEGSACIIPLHAVPDKYGVARHCPSARSAVPLSPCVHG